MRLRKLFSGYLRVYSSQAYKETMEAVEKLASESLMLLESMPEEERLKIFEHATELNEKFWDAAEQESPLAVALALLTAIRTHHEMIKRQAKLMRAAGQDD